MVSPVEPRATEPGRLSAVSVIEIWWLLKSVIVLSWSAWSYPKVVVSDAAQVAVAGRG